jgi:hypothetical protein
MASTHASDTLLVPDEAAGLLPVDPYTSMRYHFGMLLGVDDFEAADGYHRGRMSLHNAWLHGEGVVWGFDVRVDDERSDEIRVDAGLAVDAAGNELHLDALRCLSLPLWFEAHRDDPDFEVREADGGVEFEAHVVARFRPCLTRPVPALAEPCEGATSETAYSRVFSSVELLLLPGRASGRELPYHRLRLLFGLEPPIERDGAVVPSDQAVLDARAAVLARPEDERARALLGAFRRFAALDGIGLERATSGPDDEPLLFPGRAQSPVVLADVTGVRLERAGETWNVAAAEVDTSVRSAHVATATIQELLCGAVLGGVALAADPTGPRPAAADAGGPRVERDSFEVSEPRRITFLVDKALREGSIVKDAFRVSALGDTGAWVHIAVSSIDYDETANRLTLRLGRDPGLGLLRVIARGTGLTPLVGADNVPLAGAVGGPPGTVHEGVDFVHMLTRS